MPRSVETTTRFISDYDQAAHLVSEVAAAFVRHESKEDLLRRAKLATQSCLELEQAIERELPE